MIVSSNPTQERQTSIWESMAHYANTIAEHISSTYSSTCERISAVYDSVFPINPLTKRREFGNFPEYLDTKLGEVYSFALASHVCEGEAQLRVQKIANRIVSAQQDFKYEEPISIVDLDQLNAFATFGGKIFVDKKILNEIDRWDYSKEEGVTKEDVLAAVVAHEMVHAVVGHVQKIYGGHLPLGILFQVLVFVSVFMGMGTYHLLFRLIGALITSCFASMLHLSYISRRDEYQADKYGIELMKKAGYDMRGSLTLMKILHANHPESPLLVRFEKVFQWINSHPACANRSKANAKTIQEIEERSRPYSQRAKLRGKE